MGVVGCHQVETHFKGLLKRKCKTNFPFLFFSENLNLAREFPLTTFHTTTFIFFSRLIYNLIFPTFFLSKAVGGSMSCSKVAQLKRSAVGRDECYLSAFPTHILPIRNSTRQPSNHKAASLTSRLTTPPDLTFRNLPSSLAN